MQKQLNLPKCKLIQDVPTRWNSTLAMIRRFQQNKDAIVSTLALLKAELPTASSVHALPNLTSTEWELLSSLEIIFQVFEQITNEISGQKYVTASLVLVYIKMLMDRITKLSKEPASSETIKNVVGILKKEFEQRFKNYENSNTLAACTILDPRFKKLGFINLKNYEEGVKKLKANIVSAIRKTASVEEAVTDDQQACAVSSNPDDIWYQFDEEAKSLTGSLQPTATATIEVDKYLNEPLIPRKADPLKYWSERRYVYPNLFNYVKTVFCVMATSVPSEVIFSKAGNTLTAKRARLSSSKVSKMVFVQANLQ